MAELEFSAVKVHCKTGSCSFGELYPYCTAEAYKNVSHINFFHVL